MKLIVDPIGGAHLDRSWSLIAKGGMLVATAAMGALQGASTLSTIEGFAKLWLRDKLPNGRSALMFNIVDYNKSNSDVLQQDLNTLTDLYTEGQITPLIAKELPLTEAAQAQRLLLESKAKGRVTLRPTAA